jgi:phosphatidylcholine synthase
VTWSAWFVHAYTATGALLAFLAMQAATAWNFRAAFLWLFTAVLVDSTDGFLARRARVQERLPNFSGQKLDDIVDYLTFVFVPAVILWQAQAVIEPWTIPVIAAMLLSSLYGFVSADAKTDDHFFTGFPSYWNIVALYLVVLELSPVLNAVILLGLSALVFVRIGYIYPTHDGARADAGAWIGVEPHDAGADSAIADATTMDCVGVAVLPRVLHRPVTGPACPALRSCSSSSMRRHRASCALRSTRADCRT